MTNAPQRASSQPSFWDERYAEHDHLFGTAPSPFVMKAAERLAPESTVVELGAGEARSLCGLAQRDGHRVTAVDFSAQALEGATALADAHDVELETIQADVRTWRPDRLWDAVIVGFLQLLPDERLALYRSVRRLLRPGGLLIGEWFRPAHLTGEYARIGPSAADRMVPPDELRTAFADDDVLRCDPVDVHLQGSGRLRGEAAVVHLVAQRATTSDG
jgi:SAM-dependent methyltransferase